MKRIEQRFSVSYSYPVIFTRDIFAESNTLLVEVLGASERKPARLILVIDSNLLDSQAELLAKLEGFARRHRKRIQFVDSPLIMRGGEICKNEPEEVEDLRLLIEKHRMCRHSFIVAMGGGAVLDAAGFAAATTHRGMRLVRLPTTPLAQNDAGIGVKNGINAFSRKNFIGTFAPPYAVINDFSFLDTLTPRELRSGIAEAIKVSLIKDCLFFEELFQQRHKLAACESPSMESMIIRCAELHLEHIRQGGDPFEYGSSRPLDFGHWSAHAIEEISRGAVNHGEAVAIGIALDSLYACRIAMLSELELKKIFLLLEEVGFKLYHRALGGMDINRALQAFQEHLGGELTITLPDGIGRKKDLHRINIALMRACVEELGGRSKGMTAGCRDGFRVQTGESDR